MNVVSADLPGPRTPRYFAGAELIEVFPLLNLVGTESLGVGALSYAGQFNVLAVADGEGYPDLDVFAEVRATTSAHWLSPAPTFAADVSAGLCRSRDGARGSGRPVP